MKKIISLLIILLMVFSLASCSKDEKEKEVTTEEQTIGMANPIKQYDSLAEINDVTDCHIALPVSFAVSNPSYTTINDDAAQFTFDYLDHSWTIRGTHDIHNDISGIHDEHNIFEENQNSTIYLTNYFVERMFTEGQQYTVVMDNPQVNDEEMFSDTSFEIMRAIKDACDPNGIAGSYADSTSQRATMDITKYDSIYEITINWPNDASSFKQWNIAAIYNEDELQYEGEDSCVWVSDAEGNETAENQRTSNNVGKFEIKEGKLYWTGAAEEECRTCIFERIQ